MGIILIYYNDKYNNRDLVIIILNNLDKLLKIDYNRF